MKNIQQKFKEMTTVVPAHIMSEVGLEFAISNRIYELMQERSISKVGLAKAVGKRPNEVTRWLSGQHNFTIKTIALLSEFFDTPIISV